MARVAVVSLHFSPAHCSHLAAYGRLLQKLGHDVEYVLHPGYHRFAQFARGLRLFDATAPGWESAAKLSEVVTMYRSAYSFEASSWL